jgi:hypothetical protein
LNARLIAGVTLLALVFGGIYVASAIDMGWLAASLIMAIAFGLVAVVIAAVTLISNGTDREENR